MFTHSHNAKWYQYSLGTLLIVMTLTAIMCSWVASKYASLPTDEFGYSRDIFLRNAITIGSCGAVAVVCILVGVVLFCAVRYSRMNPLLALAIFIPLPLGGAFVPVPFAHHSVVICS